MKKTSWVWLVLLLPVSVLTAKTNKTHSISMIAATSIQSELPFAAYGLGQWKSEEDAEFVKLHAYFDDPITFQSIELVGCGAVFRDDVDMFINFNETIESIETQGKKSIKHDMGRQITARSVTLNFNKNKNICIENVRLFDKSGKLIDIRTPEIVEASVAASSTLEPEDSYSVMNMFDSRYEYAWSSNGKPDKVDLNFSFQDEVNITKLKVWNGYQRSDRHCIENTRARKMILTGDGDYQATIELKDTMGPQVIDLPKPFHGKKITMTISESYSGKSYQDLVISEMRFFNGENWFLVNPIAKIKSTSKQYHDKMSQSGVEAILNKRLQGMGWDMRFRSDGSFYMDGEFDEADVYSYFIGLGNFEIKSVDKNSIRVKIYGLLRTYEEEWGEMDCNGCARDCNVVFSPVEDGMSTTVEEIFSEYLIIRPKGDSFVIENENSREFLPFERLEMELDQ